MFQIKDIIPMILKTTIAAGQAILEIYKTDFEVETKSDQSPLTVADKEAHRIISAELNNTGFPILSEEGDHISYTERKQWDKFWLVDPLDGTKEFVKRNGEFTVNIAFVEQGNPVFGVVYAPVLDVLYVGSTDIGAFKIAQASKINQFEFWQNDAVLLPIERQDDRFVIVASRSHLNRETEDFIADMTTKHGKTEIISKGSSLKICMIAEGEADVYPRFAPTMEWDIAAGHAIVNASGGKIVRVSDGEDHLKYNKPDLRNPWFLVFSKTENR